MMPKLPCVLAYHAPLIVRRGGKLHHCTVDRLDWCDDDELLDSLRAETGKRTLGAALQAINAEIKETDHDHARHIYEWEQQI